MTDFLMWGHEMITMFFSLADGFLFQPSGLAGYENTPYILLFIGPLVASVLTYKVIKFFADIF